MELGPLLGASALEKHAFRLLRGLLNLLPGRLWEGKELALQALVGIATLEGARGVMVIEAHGEGGTEWLLQTVRIHTDLLNMMYIWIWYMRESISDDQTVWVDI
jgi:hypothetical protein